MQIGNCRTEPTSSVPIRAVKTGRADDRHARAADSAQHETAGPERALMQALDRVGVVRLLGQDGQGEVTHGMAFSSEVAPVRVKKTRQIWFLRDSICRGRGPSPRWAWSALPDRRLGEIGEQFISRRPRVTVSSTSPDDTDSTPMIISPVDSTAVGSRGNDALFEIGDDDGNREPIATSIRNRPIRREEAQRLFGAVEAQDGAENAKTVAPGVELAERALGRA